MTIFKPMKTKLGVGLVSILASIFVFYIFNSHSVQALGLPLNSSNPIPAGCADVDANGIINEIDCGGAPENASCSICDGGAKIPAGCVDVDGDGQIDESECGVIGSENCSAPVCSDDNVDNKSVGDSHDWTGIDLTVQDVFSIIAGLACWFSRVAVAVMVIFIILAGLHFMNARGNPVAYEMAKKNFGQVLIGLLVIIGVYVIIATVANAVGLTDFSFIPLAC